MSEDRLQQECYMWFHNKYPVYRGLLFHIPNGGARNSREGAKFRTMGVHRGVADFCFLWSGKAYFVELKTDIGKLSKEQERWAKVIIAQDFYYTIKRTRLEFKTIIETIIKSG